MGCSFCNLVYLAASTKKMPSLPHKVLPLKNEKVYLAELANDIVNNHPEMVQALIHAVDNKIKRLEHEKGVKYVT